MESGTLLHLALLRKTSKAKRRARNVSVSQRKQSRVPSLNFCSQDQNYTISGWHNQQQSIRQITNCEYLGSKERSNNCLKKRQINDIRHDVRTSDHNFRIKYRIHSQKNTSLSKLTLKQKSISQVKKMASANMYNNKMNSQASYLCKQNNSISKSGTQKFSILSSRLKKSEFKNSQQSFTNFLKLQGNKTRNFFKL